jgi:hypothetical protein
MRLIREFVHYGVAEDISAKMASIFPYVSLKGTSLFASSLTDRSGNPIVRIDSKKPLRALFIKFGEGCIEIKSLVNSERYPGLSKKIMDSFSDSLPEGYSIVIDQDVSDGFWDHMMNRYPQFEWSKK